MFNVTRTQPAPASLAAKKSYNGEDVVLALRSIFFDKCYLCETKDPTSLNVEHFDAHEGDANKKYDWNNLFFVCGRCNNIKLAKYSDLLDCTDNTCDVLSLVRHIPPHTPNQNRLTIEAMASDQKTVNTTKLIDEIFNTEQTINKKVTGAYLRKSVYRRYNRLLELINQFFDDESSDSIKADALSRLQVLMSKQQEFSAFLRWVVKGDAVLNELLGKFIV